MSCAVVAAHWTGYLNEFLTVLFGKEFRIPAVLCSDPFTAAMVDGHPVQAWVNLPAMLIIAAVTVVLVIGIRESAATNTFLVMIKIVVVLFVIGLGVFYIQQDNWNRIPIEQRRKVANLNDFLSRHPEITEQFPGGKASSFTTGEAFLKEHPDIAARLSRGGASSGQGAAERREEVGTVRGPRVERLAAKTRYESSQSVSALRTFRNDGWRCDRVLCLHRFRLHLDSLRRGH